MKEQFKQEISKYLENREELFFYRKGRVALYAILKAAGIGKGDEVVLQAFTCVVVANAIKYLGAKPVYLDIRPDTYSMDTGQLSKVITPRTRAVICQNTYGLSADLDIINDIARSKGILTIEDCAHGFGGTWHGRPNGLFSDASFFSTQWNKPFSTGIGGFALVNRPDLADAMQKMETGIPLPGITEEMMLRALLFARKHFLTWRNYWRLMKLYRWMSQYNLVTGSSDGEEVTGTDMPGKYFLGMGSAQVREGMKNLANLRTILMKRKTNASLYQDFLIRNKKTTVGEAFIPDHSFLKYPLLVRDRPLFLRLAETEKIPLSDWFVSPLHPVTGDLSSWDLDRERFPIAGEISSRMVNLLPDYDDLGKVIRFLEKNLDLIV